MPDNLVPEPGRLAPTAEDRRRLRHLPLFAGMGDGPAAELIAAASVVAMAKDQEILQAGAKPDALLALLGGKVALVAKPGPDRGPGAILGLLNPGGIVMPAAVIETAPYPLSAIALEPTRLARLPLAAVRAAMQQDSGFAAALVRSAAESWRQAVELLADQRLLSAPQRFAAHLTRLAGGRRGRVAFDIGEDRKTLASLLGMTPENLSRTIGQLREIGISLNGRHVEIADVGVAIAYAEGRMQTSIASSRPESLWGRARSEPIAGRNVTAARRS